METRYAQSKSGILKFHEYSIVLISDIIPLGTCEEGVGLLKQSQFYAIIIIINCFSVLQNS